MQWFEDTKDPETAAPKGSLRLTATARVEPLSLDRDDAARLVVACSGEELILCAASAAERDEWVQAVSAVIRAIEPEGNAPWFEDFARRRSARRGRSCRRRRGDDRSGGSAGAACRDQGDERRGRWQGQGDDGGGGEDDEDGGGGSDDENEGSNDDDDDDDDDVASPKWSIPCGARCARQLPVRSSCKAQGDADAHAGAARGAEHQVIEQSCRARARRASRRPSSGSWGACARRLAVHINGQHLSLGPDGWELRGFVGSEAELKKRVMFGSGAAACAAARALDRYRRCSRTAARHACSTRRGRSRGRQAIRRRRRQARREAWPRRSR